MLETFKVERDWLVHRSMDENGDDLYLNSDRSKLLRRLSKFSEDARRLQGLIAQELEDFVVSKGVSGILDTRLYVPQTAKGSGT